MKNYELTIENGKVTFIKDFEEVDGVVTPFDGVLYIPAEVTDLFCSDSVIGCYPEDIVVEESNQVYCAKEHCLFTKDGRELLMISRKTATMPCDTKSIGSSAFALVCDTPENYPPVLPQGLEEIQYRAFAADADVPVTFVVPDSVKEVGLMAFMIRTPKTTIEFVGDPQLELGVFGTKAELLAMPDDFWPILKTLPEVLYTKPETLHIVAPKGSNVATYCKKYGIPCVEK